MPVDNKPGRGLGSQGYRGNSELDVQKDINRRLKEQNELLKQVITLLTQQISILTLIETNTQ
jgi:hypothetical protein